MPVQGRNRSMRALMMLCWCTCFAQAVDAFGQTLPQGAFEQSGAADMARCLLDTTVDPEILGGPQAPDRIHHMDIDRDGTIWASSLRNGIWRFDGTHFAQLSVSAGNARGVPTARLDGAHTDALGNLWVATLEDGLLFRPKHSGRFQVLTAENDRYPHERALRFHAWNDRLYALGDIYGLVELDPRGGPAKTYAPAPNPSLQRGHLVIKQAWHAPGDDSLLYLTSQDGLYVFNRFTATFKHFRPETAVPQPMGSSYSINGFLSEGDTLWSGLWDHGLVGFVRASKRFVHKKLGPIRSAELQNVVMSLDRYGDAWILGTGAGLLVLDPLNWTYRLYRMPAPPDEPRMQDNWLTRSFPQGAYYVRVLEDGMIYTSSATGLRRIRPEALGLDVEASVSAAPIPHKVFWHDVHSADSSYPVFFLHDSTVLSRLGGRSVRMRYGVHFPTEAARYQTRMEGVDRAWQDQGFRTMVQYTNLKGGWHHVDVRASYDGERWSEPSRLHFQVYVPFWRRRFVQWGSGAGMLLLLLGSARWYAVGSEKKAQRQAAIEAEAVKAKAEQDRKMAALEMQALRARMNPHFLFNSLNSIRLLVMKADNDAATDYLTRFSRLVRRILEHSGTERIRLSEEMEVLRLYAQVEGMRMPGQFQYRERLDPSLNPERVLVPPLLLQPYVENAIWHGLSRKPEPGLLELVVEAHADGRSIRCSILDDGIGREASRALRAGSPTPNKNRSLGMSITEERIALTKTLYGMRIEVEVLDRMDQNGEPGGTEVVLVLYDALLPDQTMETELDRRS